MEKVLRKFKTIVVILVALLISIIAFMGINKKENGVWKNVIPEYKFSKELIGQRELKYIVDDSENEKNVYVDENGNIMGEVLKDGSPIDEETEKQEETENTSEESKSENEEVVPYAKEKRTIKVNEDDKLTKENFEKTKKIIQKRFKEQKLEDCDIRLDDVTGKIFIETKNDDQNVEIIGSLVGQAGQFKIIDYQNGLELMNNSDIKNVTAVSSNKDTYKVYLQIEFNKEGSEKLKEISKKYVEIKDEKSDENSDENTTEKKETTEEGSTEKKETEKKFVLIKLDDKSLLTTYFGDEMNAGILQIPVGEETKEFDDYKKNYDSAQQTANILNSEIEPVKYTLETDNYIKSEINSENIKNILIVSAIIIAIVTIVLIAIFKVNGVIASVLSIAYIALFSLVIRYTNVILSINSIISLITLIGINYVFMFNLMKNIKENKITNTFNYVAKRFYLSLVPIIIIGFVFTFSSLVIINSIGMIMFWGIILNVVYNLLFIKTIFKNK